MEHYSYIPKSNNELDVEICNKQNEIQRLREEIKQLELEKSKQNTDYVGRIFEMKGLEYIYVTGVDNEGIMYGVSFEDFEGSTEIWGCVVFKPEEIEREIDVKEMKYIFRDKMRWDKIKNVLD